FVDIGANMGQTLLDFIACGNERAYVGWEPNATCVYYLQKLIARNQLRECTVVPAAVADYSGVARLYRQPAVPTDTAATIISGLRPLHTNLTSAVVAVATFDSAWQALGGGPIGFVKIDVEGAELQVLRGMQGTMAAERPPILCEIRLAPRGSDLADTAERNRAMKLLLTEQGYSLLRLVKPKGQLIDVEPVDELPVDYFSEEKREDRDYLIVPNEQQAAYLAAARKACHAPANA
ncbi:MAG TPA: FkbM family methyltransferase, partial [Longimicrobiales bacterium]